MIKIRETICLFLLLLIPTSNCTKSGVQMRLTEKAMEFFSQSGRKMAENQLANKTYNDTGEADDMTYKIHDLKIRLEHMPEIKLIPKHSAGIESVMKGMALTGEGSLSYTYKSGWFTFADDIEFSMSLKGININVGTEIRLSPLGVPVVSLNSCSASIDSVNLAFHSRGSFKSWIYNIFGDTIAEEMRVKMEGVDGLLCARMRNEVTKYIGVFSTQFQTVEYVDQWVVVDYSMTKSPTITDDYMDLYFKGVFKSASNLNDSTELEMNSFRKESDKLKMGFFWVSDYSINTALSLYHHANVLEVNFVQWDEQTPQDIKNNLYTDVYVVIAPTLTTFGKLPMSLAVRSSKLPKVSINESFVSLDMFAETSFSIQMKNGTLMEAFVLQLDITASVRVLPQGQTIAGFITDFQYVVHTKISNIGEIDLTPRQFIKEKIEMFVIKFANGFLQQGFPLPTIDSVGFVNMEISLEENAVKIGTDLTYL